MKKHPKQNALTSAEILARIASEEANSYGVNDSELTAERAEAINFYLGKPLGNEIEGRSQVISTDVADTIEALMPQLVKVFLSGDEVVRFDPRDASDIEGAAQETEVINHITLEKNNGFIALYTAMKDALLSKTGYIKVYWEDKEEIEKEFYKGLTDDEFALIAQDNDVEIIEHEAYPDQFALEQQQAALQNLQNQLNQAQQAAAQGNPQAQQAVQQLSQQMQQIQAQQPMLHDVRVQTVETRGCIEIEPVAPESMKVAYDTKSISLSDSRFVQHSEWTTIADLREEGFDVSDTVGFSEREAWEAEEQARDIYGEDYDSNFTGLDRRVLVKDTYMRVNGELMRYVVVGNEIIHQEEAEIIPFAALTPIIMPHRHVGRSIADLVRDIHIIKTTIMRGQLDGMYLALNPRTAISERVNLDDMLVSRPGGVVRVQGTVGDAMMPMPTPDVSQIGYPMLEYMDSVKEKRTGVNNQMAGIDPNTLNTTATQANILQNNAMDRVALIARIFAETGFKELFMLVHRLMRTHSTREMSIRIRGQWVTVDPRTWKNRYDMSISVGLGTGNKDQQLAHLNNLYQIAMGSMQAGVQIVSPKGLYGLVSKMTTNAGFKNPEEFWQDPSQVPPQPPQENPMITIEKMKLQADQQKFQAQAQLDQQKAQQDLQQEQLRSQNDVQIEQAKIQRQMELERWKAQLDAETELQKTQMQLQAEIAIEQFKAENESAMALKEHKNELGGMLEKAKGSGDNSSQVLLTGLQAIMQSLNQPKQIIRGADGKAVGVAPMGN